MGVRRLVRVVVSAVVGSFLLVALGAPPAAAARPYCGIWWGSLGESAEGMRQSPLVDIRVGRHRCFDRIVFDLAGPAPGYDVSYVPTVYSEGRGDPIPLRGAADLQIIVKAPAYDEHYDETYDVGNPRELVSVRGFRTFRQVAWGGSFEGQTTIGLGVRARLPFRVFTLPGPGTGSRVVVDVAHRW